MYKNPSARFIDEPLLEIGRFVNRHLRSKKKDETWFGIVVSGLKFIFYVIRCLILIIFMHRFINT